MAKGIVYIMTTTVSGLVKIGKTRTDSYQERMRFLEANGYYNVAGLKRFFAIELEDYDDKESLLHEIFSKSQVGSSELFSLDQELARQLLLSFDGTVIYPEKTNKEREFDEVSQTRRQSARFSFYKKGLKNGDMVVFSSDKNITARVASEREVEYGGQLWKLSPLTYKVFEQKNQLTASGAYQGAAYWSFGNKKLKDILDITR
ncbi:MAG: GIY-YIG nuclease family protein [Candidatus Saccharimonas sp.]